MFADIAKQIASDLASAIDRNGGTHPLNSSQLQTLIQSLIRKCDLVSREEFDAQTAVLQRTRTKIDHLEKQLTELELKISGKDL